MTTIREIKILKSLDHRNVVPIVDMVVQPSSFIQAIRIGNVDHLRQSPPVTAAADKRSS